MKSLKSQYGMPDAGQPRVLVLCALFTVMWAAVPLMASVNVTGVTCTRHVPWDGQVDVDYEIVCDDPSADVWVYSVGYDASGDRTFPLLRCTGDGAVAPVKPGKRRMTCDIESAAPGLSSAAFSVRLYALVGGAPYLVVDLSGGADATNYPVSYLPTVPSDGWTEPYKTTNLVLRLIAPGTFRMGSPSDELGRDGNEVPHTVTLTKPYYIGVFETTQRQWELVMGANPAYCKGDARPVGNLSYVMMRGSFNGLGWPFHDQVDDDSFMGRLRRRTGLKFDLPTEAQWEYACRAGTVTALPSGKNLTNTGVCPNVNEIAHYVGNKNDGKGGYTGAHTTVGSYLPNDWGLYDVIGNVCEMTLDRAQGNLGGAAVTDPKGPSTATRERVYRSSWADNDGANLCRSARRAGRNYDEPVVWMGCRIALPVLDN